MKINKNFTSPNFSVRSEAIEFIILHYTEMKCNEAIARLCDPIAKVSAHYFIKENGEILQLIDDKHVSWHSGVSHWKNREKLNNFSIGIELDNNGFSPFSRPQMEACVSLCKYLSEKYNINQANILGHSDISPDRKIDPGIFFDWGHLASHNLGIWYDQLILQDPLKIIFEFGHEGEELRNLQQNLKKLGYKIEVTGLFDLQTNYVIRAFQLHFNPNALKIKSLDFVRNNNSLYSWDNISDKILFSLNEGSR